MEPLRLQIVISFDQPLSAADADLEQACTACYEPLLSTLARHPTIRVSLHLTGHLLDFLSRRRPEFLAQLKGMAESGQVEILGGLFYGAIPALLPELDVRGQIQMAAEYWESFIGTAPVGFWLPELAYAQDLPRLLDETGLRYGFISSSQVRTASGVPAMGCAQWGGHTLALFVLSEPLSSALPVQSPDDWCQALLSEAVGPEQLANVWVRAESLGLEPGTRQRCLEQGWLDEWLATVGSAEIQTVLPSETLAHGAPLVPLRVNDEIPDEIRALGRTPGRMGWTDFSNTFVEARRLYGRMLRVSEKLRLTIDTMEEEGLEDDWSDTLATAQRLVFSAQAHGVYWRGLTPGFSDPRLRDAVSQRLLQAEQMIDTLVQGEDDWIASEEGDWDADQVDEILVANRQIVAWIVPACGGSLRALDDRLAHRDILDVGSRRTEPFASDMAQAELREGAPPSPSPTPRGQGLVRLSTMLPGDADDVERSGTKEWLLEPDANLDEYLSGAFHDRHRYPPPVEILQNEIDADGDGTYRLSLKTQLQLGDVHDSRVALEKTIAVPIDEARVSIDYQMVPTGPREQVLACELPLRLESHGLRIWLNGEPQDVSRAELIEVARLRFLDGRGHQVDIELSPSVDVWLAPIQTAVRDLEGYRAADQGLLVLPLFRLRQDPLSARVTIALGQQVE